jgi:hypothetical protein
MKHPLGLLYPFFWLTSQKTNGTGFSRAVSDASFIYDLVFDLNLMTLPVWGGL